MLITVIAGEDIASLEVSEDMELENLVALIRLEIPTLASIPNDRLVCMNGANQIALRTADFKRTVGSYGLKDQDALYVMAEKAAQAPSVVRSSPQPQAPRPSASGSRGPATGDVKSLIGNLVSQIRVPPKGSQGSAVTATTRESEKFRKFTRQIFDKIHDDPMLIRQFRLDLPEVEAAYEKHSSDYEAFHKALAHAEADKMRRLQLVHDGSSVEGQQFIADQIRRQAILEQYEYAMEHIPEAYIPINLLHVVVKINGVEVMAMIDSGAQTSIMSINVARKCNIADFVDSRFERLAAGIGGHSTMRGRIHACKVQMGNSYVSCTFDVMEEGQIELLMGLTFLRPNGCIIDLKRNALVMDGAEAPFLNEEEYKRELARLGQVGIVPRSPIPAPTVEEDTQPQPAVAAPPPRQVEVDPEKLSQLIGVLGINAEQAAAVLRRFNNDVERAIQSVLDEDGDLMPGPSGTAK